MGSEMCIRDRYKSSLFSPHFSILIDGKTRGAKSVTLQKDGNLDSVEYHPTLFIDDEKDSNSFYEIFRSYYSADGKEIARVARHTYIDPENEAKDSTISAIFVFSKEGISTIPCPDQYLHNINSITFTDEGKIDVIWIKDENGILVQFPLE